MADEVVFGDGFIDFLNYPFFPASVRTRPRVEAGAIREVDLLGSHPPALRVGDELLFVGSPKAGDLAAFAARHGLRVRQRFDVWSALLEPFLDVGSAPGQERRTLEALAAHGVTPEETAGIRKRVERKMLRWNAVAWEWAHLGLYDVLLVLQPKLLGRAAFGRFYREAMALALRSYREKAP